MTTQPIICNDQASDYVCAMQPPLPRGFTRQLFGGLYDKPLCSLYAASNATGFSGHCTKDLPQQCSFSEKWCGRDSGRSNAGSDLVEELMALQMAKVIPILSFHFLSHGSIVSHCSSAHGPADGQGDFIPQCWPFIAYHMAQSYLIIACLVSKRSSFGSCPQLMTCLS